MATKNVLCVPDMHAPYQHKKTIPFLEKVADIFKIDEVMCLGDELDQYTASQYSKTPEAYNGDLEYDLAMEFMEKFYDAFPAGRSCTSNHVERVAKRASEAGISKAYLKPVREFMQAPEEWEWRDHWVRDNVQYEHGERAGGVTGLRNLVVTNMMNTVVGHNHSAAGTVYVNNGKKLLWGMNCGCLVDLASVAFKYGNNSRLKSVIGCGVILDGIPLFIPMESVV